MDEVARVIGTLEAGLAAQKEQTAALSAKVDSMDGKIDILLSRDAQARGARRVMAAGVIGGGSVLSALVGWAVTWWSGRP